VGNLIVFYGLVVLFSLFILFAKIMSNLCRGGKRINKCRNWFKESGTKNLLIRTVIESYFDAAMSSAVVVFYLIPKERFSQRLYYIAIFTFGVMTMIPFYIALYMFKKRGKVITDVEKKELSAIYENMNNQNMLQNMFYFFFFIRRLSMIFLILFFNTQPQL